MAVLYCVLNFVLYFFPVWSAEILQLKIYRNCLLPCDVVDKYREAMMHYSKVHLHRKKHIAAQKKCVIWQYCTVC